MAPGHRGRTAPSLNSHIYTSLNSHIYTSLNSHNTEPSAQTGRLAALWSAHKALLASVASVGCARDGALERIVECSSVATCPPAAVTSPATIIATHIAYQ